MATFGWPCYNAGMNTDLPVPPQFAHMAKAACLVLLHPNQPLFAVCSRRGSTIDGFPGGKQDPGEKIKKEKARENAEEIGVHVDASKLELLFADAIPGKKDFWVETFIAVSPTTELKQMEDDITVKWTNWTAFNKNNAFKQYNDGVYSAWQEWFECRQLDKPYTMGTYHLKTTSPAPEFPGY